ncbi:MAG: hypothetical protein WBP81_20125 [Solirubrobacteraceae bacterium]
MTHSISGWVIAPSALNWIESEHIWLPAGQTPSAGYTWAGVFASASRRDLANQLKVYLIR